MAKNDDKKSIRDMQDKSSRAVFGTDTTLNHEQDQVSSIIRAITANVSKDFGKQANGSLLNYWNEVSLKDLYKTVMPSSTTDKYADYNKFMESEGFRALKGLFESNRVLQKKIENYNAINNYIPECSKALQILKTNIMSPDDYSKMIFNVDYAAISKDKEQVVTRLEDLIEKYGIEDYCDEIVTDTLKDSKVIFAILSLESEFVKMINNIHDNGMLTEALHFADANVHDVILDRNNFTLNTKEVEILRENMSLNESAKNDYSLDNFTPEQITEYLREFVNYNVIVGSSKELLQEDINMKNAFLGDEVLGMIDIETAGPGKRGRGRPKKEVKKIGINGSVIHRLPAGKVVEIKKDNICYGYYLIEGISDQEAGLQSTYDRLNKITPPGSLNFVNQIDINVNNGNIGNSPADNLTDIFAKAIAEKLDAPFLRKNADFQLQIYEIMKNSRFGKDLKMKVTFFDASEICVWECPSIFEKIEFFAKLYLTMLTNDILLALGRSHDKRVFYVNMGEDKDYEQAIQNIIRDIKQKEFKMDEINDINAILQLNPGMFNDYFMPMYNGERPIEIDTLQGMNQQVDNEFLNWLKETMANGLPVPKTVIDATNDPDLAHTVASQNGMFARDVIRYQKKFTPSFEKMLRILYKNEYAFAGDKANPELESVDLNKIQVHFPSPLTLNMTSLIETFQNASTLAESIATVLVTADEGDADADRKRQMLTSQIIKDYVPNVAWEKYEDLLKADLGVEATKKAIKKRNKTLANDGAPGPADVDPYAGY